MIINSYLCLRTSLITCILGELGNDLTDRFSLDNAFIYIILPDIKLTVELEYVKVVSWSCYARNLNRIYLDIWTPAQDNKFVYVMNGAS